MEIKRYLRKSDFIVNTYSAVKPYCTVIKKFSRRYVPIDAIAKKEYQTISETHESLSEEYSKKTILLGEIEINKNCNLNCIMCNTHLSKRKDKNMDLNLFETLIIEMKKRGQYTISLHTIGEPLLNPLLEEYFKILRKHRIKAFLSSNGQLLNQKLHLLCAYTDIIETIRFSIDGATQETYEKIRKPGKFNRLIENLNQFNDINKREKIFWDVKIDSIVSEDVQHELAYHLKFYSRYTDMSNIGLHLMSGLSPDNSYFLDKSILKKHIELNSPCTQLNSGLHILNDGWVTACCRDYNGDLIYGSIIDHIPEELINNQKIRQLREYHIKRNLPKGHFCTTCYRINPKVSALWEVFVRLLIQRYSHRWDVEQMQLRFNRFFEIFRDRIPTRDEYVSLFI